MASRFRLSQPTKAVCSSGLPTMEFPANDRRHGVDPGGVGVEAWHESIFAPAGSLVELAVRHPHLFEGFETVRRETWTQDREA